MRRLLLSTYSCLAVLFFCISISCSNPSAPAPPLEDVLFDDLEDAYSKQSATELMKFYAMWQVSALPRQKRDIYNQSDEKIALYEIYKVFYDPFNTELFSTYYKDRVTYIVIQEKLGYSIGEDPELHYIEDFRPPVSFRNAQILYLNESYDTVLNRFIEKQSTWERVKFLNRFVNIVPAHWFGWHIESFPYVFQIHLENDLCSAVVYFMKDFWQGGEARFIRNGTQWKMTEIKTTWIM
ncbi:hypothetical protein ACFL6L_03885 [candidate division KSB1 bacterium]